MLNHIPSRPSSPVKQHPQSHSKKLQVPQQKPKQASTSKHTPTSKKSIVQSHIDLYRPKCLSESISRQRPSIDKHVTPTIPKQKPLASDRSKQSPFVPYSEKIAPNGKYAQMLKDAAKPAKKPKHPTNPIDDAFLTNWGKSFWDPNLNLSMSEFSLVGPVSFVGGASELAKYTTLEYNGSVSEVHVSQITASAAEPVSFSTEPSFNNIASHIYVSNQPSVPPTTLLYNNDTRESFESSLDFSVPTISKSPIKTSSPHPSPAQISVKASANNVFKGEATIETNETAPLDKVVKLDSFTPPFKPQRIPSPTRFPQESHSLSYDIQTQTSFYFLPTTPTMLPYPLSTNSRLPLPTTSPKLENNPSVSFTFHDPQTPITSSYIHIAGVRTPSPHSNFQTPMGTAFHTPATSPQKPNLENVMLSALKQSQTHAKEALRETLDACAAEIDDMIRERRAQHLGDTVRRQDPIEMLRRVASVDTTSASILDCYISEAPSRRMSVSPSANNIASEKLTARNSVVQFEDHRQPSRSRSRSPLSSHASLSRHEKPLEQNLTVKSNVLLSRAQSYTDTAFKGRSTPDIPNSANSSASWLHHQRKSSQKNTPSTANSNSGLHSVENLPANKSQPEESKQKVEQKPSTSQHFFLSKTHSVLLDAVEESVSQESIGQKQQKRTQSLSSIKPLRTAPKLSPKPTYSRPTLSQLNKCQPPPLPTSQPTSLKSSQHTTSWTSARHSTTKPSNKQISTSSSTTSFNSAHPQQSQIFDPHDNVQQWRKSQSKVSNFEESRRQSLASSLNTSRDSFRSAISSIADNSRRLGSTNILLPPKPILRSASSLSMHSRVSSGDSMLSASFADTSNGSLVYHLSSVNSLRGSHFLEPTGTRKLGSTSITLPPKPVLKSSSSNVSVRSRVSSGGSLGSAVDKFPSRSLDRSASGLLSEQAKHSVKQLSSVGSILSGSSRIDGRVSGNLLRSSQMVKAVLPKSSSTNSFQSFNAHSRTHSRSSVGSVSFAPATNLIPKADRSQTSTKRSSISHSSSYLPPSCDSRLFEVPSLGITTPSERIQSRSIHSLNISAPSSPQLKANASFLSEQSISTEQALPFSIRHKTEETLKSKSPRLSPKPSFKPLTSSPLRDAVSADVPDKSLESMKTETSSHSITSEERLPSTGSDGDLMNRKLMTGSARAQSSVHLSASKNRVALKTKAQSVAKLETTNYSTPPVFIPSLSVEDYSITSMDSRSVSDSVNLTSQPHLPTPTRRKSIGKHSASPSFKGSPDPILESSFESVHIDHELRRSSSVTSRTAHMSSSMMHQFKQNLSEVSLRNNDSIRPTSSTGQNKCIKDSSTVTRESLEAKINTTSSSRPTSPQQNLVGSLAFIERPSKIPTRSPSLSTLNIPLVSSTTFTGIPGLNTSISVTKPPTTAKYQTSPFLSSSKIPVSGAEKLRQQLAESRIFPQQKPLLSAYSDIDFSTLLTRLQQENQSLYKIAHHIEVTMDDMNSGLSRLHTENMAMYPHLNRAVEAVHGMKELSRKARMTVAKHVQKPGSRRKTPEPLLENTHEMNMAEMAVEFLKYTQESYEESVKLLKYNTMPVSLPKKRRPVLESNVTLFAVGQNDDGQLGIYNNEDDGGIPCTNQFKLVALKHLSDTPVEIVKVACGGMHVLALTAQGQVLSWGAGDFIGRFTNTTNWKPQYIEFPQENVSIVDICCGECFSAVLDQLGRIWAWGSFRDMTGKEHFDGKTKRQQSPSLLESNLAAVSFSAGESHFVVLYENGSVRGWGINSHGQLGRPCHGKELNENCVGIPIVLPAQFRPTSIYACGFSTFVTGKDGNGVFSLLACGGNGYGELGMGQEVTSWQLREVCVMGGKNVVDIKGGLHHTVLLDDVGDVYVAGRGDSGQLGLGLTVQHSNVFIQIPLPSKANGITCSTSGNQTYISICDGTLYSMGYNCYGQLGLKHEESVVTAPSLVPLKSRKALLMAAGSQFLIVGASDRIE